MADTAVRTVINPLQPGAYSFLDASALQNSEQFATGTVLGLVGYSLGGVPLTPLNFRGPGPAKDVLRGGPLYDLVRFAFGGGASLVKAIRLGGDAAPATKTIEAATSGNFIVITALDYGTWTNDIKITVLADNVIVLTYVDPLGVTYTETFDGGATGTAAQVAALITEQSRFVKAAAASPLGTGIAKVTSIGALSGGDDGEDPAAQDWTDALAVLETQDVDIVVAATDDATVHALVSAHCDAMAQPLARKERTTVVGGALGEDPAAAIDRADDLRTPRVQVVYPGFYDYADNGDLTLYPPSLLAGKIAGMHAGLPDPAWSLTHKPVNIVDVERQLSTVQDGDLDRLLAAQVTPVAAADGGGFWVVDSLSTYNTDGSFQDYHKIRTADYVARYARTRLEGKFVGAKTLSGSQSSIQAAAVALLRELMQAEVIRGYQVPTVDSGPNLRTWQVALPVMLPDTTKFILITVALQPGGAASVDSGVTNAGALS